jgi:translation initiation factor eIF-2B subunit alpha
MGIDTNSAYVFQSWDATSISLSAACDLFMRFVTRTSHLEHEKFDAAKSRLIERGEKFGEISLKVIHISKTFQLLSSFCTRI